MNSDNAMNVKPARSRRKAMVIAGTAAILAALVFARIPGAAQAEIPSEGSSVRSMMPITEGFSDLVSQVRPAVVKVEVERPLEGFSPMGMLPERFRHFRHAPQGRGHGQERRHRHHRRGMGSGFIIDPAGLIVTNHHVVEKAKEIRITLDDGRTFEAHLRGSDPKTDLALLEIDADEDLPAVAFGDSEAVRVGDWVVAMGNPFGLGGTVTVGVVSARGRDIGSGPFDDYLQVDAPINRGNSGGPLFDLAGNVVGVNSAIYSPTGGNVGIAFSVPADLAKPIIASLQDSGSVERGWLGVHIQPIDPTLADALGLDGTEGALVASVLERTPADRSGILAGDVILSFDGQSVQRMKDLPRIVAGVEAGTQVDIDIWRKGERQSLKATIAAQEMEDESLAMRSDEPESSQGARLGLSLAAPRDGNRPGLRIVEIEPESPADRSELMVGDIILGAGDKEVEQARDITGAVQAAHADNKPVLLLISRRGNRLYIAVETAAG
ncbi:Do family serine endopeptidase [Thioalkalivibrio sp. HK1]|uniref:Do family serine endopeptidase n=1 Tax=Thioalkalivibrio sp. HK1 TaxID=1469245 RepID=UPI000471C5AF|nr:Do family serine endopeptidase [Thioalkalivibrio sp. HK1]